MGVAEILSKNKSELNGTVKFIFQPAEEGVSDGEAAGAELMIKEGVLENPKVDVAFGLHIQALLPLGQLAYRPEGLMAAVDAVNIKVTGVGAHGATPWDSVDPIVVSGEIITGLQTIVSRQTDLTKAAAVITIGSLHGGIRRNIIPEVVTMEGTIRTFDPEMQKKVHEKIKLTATKIAEASGATADVSIITGYPVELHVGWIGAKKKEKTRDFLLEKRKVFGHRHGLGNFYILRTGGLRQTRCLSSRYEAHQETRSPHR